MSHGLRIKPSRVLEKTKMAPVHGKGVEPEIYIKWTPEHIERDVDLERALEFLNIKV
ncbi:hypothetical protein [Falsibacillus albus]|uniref:hypothetical protein n=1 Tax=Falsibacillus albus TaxID=2478915 RepID=UPI001314A002|nr:hypothetical protein [Falsibacillus albus]